MVSLEEVGKATKSVPRDNLPAMVPVDFQNKKDEWTRTVFRLPYACCVFFVTVCRQPLRNTRGHVISPG